MIMQEKLIKLLHNAANGDKTVDLKLLCDEAYYTIIELKRKTEAKVPRTKGDLIRAMSDEELARFITETNFCDLLCKDYAICHDGRCDKHMLNWLKQEAKV